MLCMRETFLLTTDANQKLQYEAYFIVLETVTISIAVVSLPSNIRPLDFIEVVFAVATSNY